MTSNRIWIAGTILLIIVLLAGTYFIGVGPQIAAAATATADRANVAAQNAGHEQALKQLKEDAKGIKKLESDLADLRMQVPDDVNQTPFIDEIGRIGAANGVRVDSVTFTDPLPYIPGTSTDPAVSAAMQSVATQGFVVIPVEITAVGTTAATMQFLRALQNSTRLVLAYEVTFEGTDDLPETDETLVTVSGEIFVLSESAIAVVEPPVTTVDGAVTE